MNEIITELLKPVWWVSVVVAGIVINLLSGYLKSSMDSGLSKLFRIWNDKSVKRKSEWEGLVKKIATSDAEYQKALALESRTRLQSIHMLLIAIFISNFPFVMSLEVGDKLRWFNLFFYFISASMFFISYLASLSAASTARAIREAKG